MERLLKMNLSANVPDFYSAETASSGPVGTKCILEQLPADLISQGGNLLNLTTS